MEWFKNWRRSTSARQPSLAETLEIGQVWRYRTRPHDQNSTLVIGSIDSTAQGLIIGILVQGLSLGNSQGECLEELSHLPIAEPVLRSSLTAFVRDRTQLPLGFHQGYKAWRKAFDLRKAGFYSIPVSACVALAEETFLKPSGK
jgi:hypothetical protein